MKVFISHSFDDKKLAYELDHILSEYGIEGYLAEEDLKLGSRLEKKIEDELFRSEYVIVIFTEKAKASATVNQEIGLARGKRIKLIIMLEDGVIAPILIGHREAEVFTRENFSEHCKRVAEFMTDVKMKEIQNGKILKLVKGDITERKVDVIVNAANSYLKHHAGVAGAIVKKGGYIIQKESDKIGHVPVGSAVITTSGKLPCKAVIHAVGPRMGEGDEDNKLKDAVINSLILASQKGFHSLSMPAISAGIYGFPKNRCAEILVSESRKFFSDNPKTTLETIEFCIYEDETLSYFTKQFERI
ncbi:MAG: macro domain-containing protein [Nitrosotalea sp.]